MSTLGALLQQGHPVPAHRPWPRGTIDTRAWQSAVDGLVSGEFTLMGLWGDDGAVHMALLDNAAGEFGVASLRRRQSAWSGPSPICSGTVPPVRRTGAPGSTTAAGRSAPRSGPCPDRP
jgi:hypothetical protein